MDFLLIVKTALPLLALGFTTAAIASLFVAFIISSTTGGIVTGIVMIVLAGALLFFAFFHNDSVKLKAILIFAAVFDIVGGITSCCVKTSFHDESAYLNKVVVYFVFLSALMSSIGYFWHFLTGLFVSGALEAAAIDLGQETTLYVFWGLIVSLIEAFIIPLKESYYTKELVTGAIVYSIGFWFLGGLLAGAIGAFIAIKGDSGVVAEKAEPLSTASAVSEYDKIG